jgi:4-carboxymuconolactone decarboxylase
VTRIPPLAPGERDEQARELLAQARGGTGPDANIFTTLVRHPGLFRKWLPFGGKLLNGRLPARSRELMILRTGWNCRAEYEWGQHVPIARRAGLTDAEIAAIAEPLIGASWSALDAALLRAADELHGDARISDATWTTLAAAYDERQLIELCMLIGHYHLVAFTLNSLGVELDAGLPPLPPAGG